MDICFVKEQAMYHSELLRNENFHCNETFRDLI